MNTMENLNNISAEQSVIGGLLGADWTDNALFSIETLKHTDFYLKQHSVIWQSITEMSQKGDQVDIITLAENMRNNGLEFEFSYLGEMVRNTPSQANMKNYARIVKDLSRLRTALKATIEASTVLTEAGDPQGKLNKALGIVSTIGQDDAEDNQIKSSGDVLGDLLDDIQRSFESGGKVDGVLSGLENIDAITKGFKPADLIILAARPSMGKTTLAMNIAENVSYLSEDNKKSLVFSLEMPAKQLMKKTISRFGSLSTSKMDDGSCVASDTDTAKLDHGMQTVLRRKNNMYIDDKGGQHISQIQSRAKRLFMKHGGFDLIVIDYLQLISSEGENQNIRIGNVSAGLKILAKDLGVPILVLSQLNRDITGRPTLRNLRDSGSLEQDADVVIFLHDEDYEGNRGDHSLTEVIFAKQRMGITGSTFLQPELAFSRFSDTKRLPEPKHENESGSGKRKFKRYD
jgi:replicative DNA helicase